MLQRSSAFHSPVAQGQFPRAPGHQRAARPLTPAPDWSLELSVLTWCSAQARKRTGLGSAEDAELPDRSEMVSVPADRRLAAGRWPSEAAPLLAPGFRPSGGAPERRAGNRGVWALAGWRAERYWRGPPDPDGGDSGVARGSGSHRPEAGAGPRPASDGVGPQARASQRPGPGRASVTTRTFPGSLVYDRRCTLFWFFSSPSLCEYRYDHYPHFTHQKSEAWRSLVPSLRKWRSWI